MTNFHFQKAFTLIELMIALVLGLLIVAAGLSLFLSAQRSLSLQSGMSELQQNANFGLSLLTHDLRHTNLNTISSQRVNNFTIGSGIIFSTDNLPSSITDFEDGHLTLMGEDDDNTDGKSDRLTIQYKPETSRIFNCEGEEITDASDKVIVQRYYLATSPRQVTGEPTAYSLFCDAGWYEDGDTEITGLSDTSNGQQIMQRIDAFKVRLGVKNPDAELRYMTIDEYEAAMNVIRAACGTPIDEDTCSTGYLNVVSIEVGILARSTGTIGADASLNTQTEFNLAGAEVELTGTNAVNRRYLRQVVSQLVAIRNTLGAS